MLENLEDRLRSTGKDFPGPTAEAEEKARSAAIATALRVRMDESKLDRPPATNRRAGRKERLLRVRLRPPDGRAIAWGIGAIIPAIALGAVLGVLVWPGATGAQATEQAYPGPIFSEADGWASVAATGWPDSSAAPLAWTTNAPLTEDIRADAIYVDPNSPLRNLPEEGIFVVAWLANPDQVPAPVSREETYIDRALPLQISDAEIQSSWLGQPSDQIPQYLLPSRVKQQWVDVRVYFGTQNPDRNQLAEAQEALERLLIPDPDVFSP